MKKIYLLSLTTISFLILELATINDLIKRFLKETGRETL